MKAVIRNAAAADYADCARLVMEVHVLHVEHEPWLCRMPEDGKVWQEEEFSAMVEGPESVVLVAEIDGQAVGFAQLQMRETSDQAIIVPRRSCSVESIGVTSEWQGQGIGQQLMAAAREWGRENRADEVTLSVHDFNQAAIRFYNRLGFEDYIHRMRLSLRPGYPPQE
jgi:ribosomal protein S18 acetylase RimI-like enzyme